MTRGDDTLSSRRLPTACGRWARPHSNLDLFIDYDPASRFNGFDLVGITLFLEDESGIAVDVTTRESLHPRLREHIERSAVKVF